MSIRHWTISRTDPVDRTEIYRVTDDNREIVQALMSNDLLTPKADRRRLSDLVGGMKSGTLFRTDTLFSMQYQPRPRKHSYRGNVYILTGHRPILPHRYWYNTSNISASVG